MQYLFIGLGNPGKEYENTRHNLGREMLLLWQKKADFAGFEFNKKFNALVSKNKKTVLLLPETFMNNSGKAAGAASRFFKIKPENTIVLHDDIDIEFGRTKLSFNRSTGGHKGADSVRRALKTEKFWRLRIGIQPPGKKKHTDAMKIILQKFRGSDELALKKLRKKVLEGLEMILEEGPERTMNIVNQG